MSFNITAKLLFGSPLSISLTAILGEVISRRGQGIYADQKNIFRGISIPWENIAADCLFR